MPPFLENGAQRLSADGIEPPPSSCTKLSYLSLMWFISKELSILTTGYEGQRLCVTTKLPYHRLGVAPATRERSSADRDRHDPQSRPRSLRRTAHQSIEQEIVYGVCGSTIDGASCLPCFGGHVDGPGTVQKAPGLSISSDKVFHRSTP